MFKKDFIREEDGKIRDCFSNVSKMNILEYLIFRKFFAEGILESTEENFVAMLEGILNLMFVLTNLLILIIFPISFPIISFFAIREAKTFMKDKERLMG